MGENTAISGDDTEPASLEYEEDCYYAYVSKTDTPSFDEDVAEEDCVFVIVEEEFDEPTSLGLEETDPRRVEAEVFDKKSGRNKWVRGVRVKFEDLSKPYLAKITNHKNYSKFLQLVRGEEVVADVSPDSGINELAGLSPEEQERQKQEWADELAKVEEEIQTLRHVLASKMKASQELKRKLGFSVWREFQDDMSQGIRNVKESNVYQNVEGTISQIGKAVTEAPLYHNVEEKVSQVSKAVTEAPIYQKTESVIKTTAEKTTSLLGGLGTGFTSKIGALKNSDSFRSFEDKLGSAYENVKTKVTTSRSNSMVSFDEALREAEANRKSPATTPTINEERPS
ncbi:tumor protein D54-like isoform X1 [Macrosteles quadrilineatus]|uniref:tumor protein D54-like isoform X1 n=1 Tax=Macrosteles quadrilineatus TaxID=74068 RepID=UPI0023E20E56|nr:tumor protein D54-like isoform X1 [Macrosteles quadrilineatus]